MKLRSFVLLMAKTHKHKYKQKEPHLYKYINQTNKIIMSYLPLKPEIEIYYLFWLELSLPLKFVLNLETILRAILDQEKKLY